MSSPVVSVLFLTRFCFFLLCFLLTPFRSFGSSSVLLQPQPTPYAASPVLVGTESQNNLCNKCKQPGHFARECTNAAVCNNCGLPGHVVAECTTKSLCWNCREPGHMAINCTNEGICHTCGKTGHRARDCTDTEASPKDTRLCNNCYKPGHIASECSNDKACKNCRMTGHLARDCQNEPVCNLCNVSGHVARECTKADIAGDNRGHGGRHGGGGYRDVVCHSCNQVGHMSRDCMASGSPLMCHNCGGRGHKSFECPSARMDHGGNRCKTHQMMKHEPDRCHTEDHLMKKKKKKKKIEGERNADSPVKNNGDEKKVEKGQSLVGSTPSARRQMTLFEASTFTLV
ncbi:hypothetical protein V2J09_007237 [Rumex salicifolius]